MFKSEKENTKLGEKAELIYLKVKREKKVVCLEIDLSDNIENLKK